MIEVCEAVGWEWATFRNDVGVALLGGLAGGGIAAAVAIYTTGKTFKHDAEQAREAARQERDASRELLNQQTYVQLLDLVGEATRLLPYLWLAGSVMGREPDGVTREAILALFREIRRGSEVLTMVLPSVVRRRWHRPERLFIELRDTNLWAEGSQPPEDTMSWRDNDHRLSARADVRMYAHYVRLTLLALLDGRTPPPDQPPPVVQRLMERRGAGRTGISMRRRRHSTEKMVRPSRPRDWSRFHEVCPVG